MEEKKYNRRLIGFGIISTFVIIGLGLRLYHIQINKSPIYGEMALKQRSGIISLSPERGTIYDRNLVPLTNIETTPVIVLPKALLEEDIELYNELLQNTLLTHEEFINLIESSKGVMQIPVKDGFISKADYSQMFRSQLVNRYMKDNPLSHVIGYVNRADNVGDSGIEKLYDEFLNIQDKKTLVLEYDKSRRIILDGSEHVTEVTDPNIPSGVKLTIDYEIQKIVENILDESRANGAVIVAQPQTGKILAMASRPNFEQDNIIEYLDNKHMALYNKAIQVSYPPGSIFKTVVLMAALESNYDFINESYECTGYEEVHGLRIKCTGEHGILSLREAFSKSCNSAFIQIGERIGSHKIIQMAERLGMGSKINIELLEESEGNLSKGSQLLGAAIGNISIGQGDVEATPLQITNMMMILVNNGIEKKMSMVEGITNKDGKILKYINKRSDRYVISEEISSVVMNYLRDVVRNGTGASIDTGFIGGAGGKTGSAQAILNRNPAVHGWFSGFFPERDPQYVITVLVEEGKSGARSAAPIFEKISKEIIKIYPVY